MPRKTPRDGGVGFVLRFASMRPRPDAAENRRSVSSLIVHHPLLQ